MKPSWKFRRRAVFGSLIFAALIVIYVLWRWDDTGLAQTTIISAFGLMGAIVASYIGGAVFEDTRPANISAREAEKTSTAALAGQAASAAAEETGRH